MVDVMNIPLRDEIFQNLITIYGDRKAINLLYKKYNGTNITHLLILAKKMNSYEIVECILHYVLQISTERDLITELLRKSI